MHERVSVFFFPFVSMDFLKEIPMDGVKSLGRKNTPSMDGFSHRNFHGWGEKFRQKEYALQKFLYV